MALFLEEILEPSLVHELDFFDLVQFRVPSILRVVGMELVDIKVKVEVKVEFSDGF